METILQTFLSKLPIPRVSSASLSMRIAAPWAAPLFLPHFSNAEALGCLCHVFLLNQAHKSSGESVGNEPSHAPACRTHCTLFKPRRQMHTLHAAAAARTQSEAACTYSSCSWLDAFFGTCIKLECADLTAYWIVSSPAPLQTFSHPPISLFPGIARWCSSNLNTEQHAAN